MKKGFVFLSTILILFICFIVPFVSAEETQINIETLSNHDVSILILADSETYTLLEMFNNKPSGQYGNVSVIYASSGRASINLQIIVKQNGEQVMSEKFTEVKTGSPVNLQVLPEWVKNPVVVNSNSSDITNSSEVESNETNNSTSPLVSPDVESETENKTGINFLNANKSSTTAGVNTGFLVSEFGNIFVKNKFFWIIIGVVLIGGALIFVGARKFGFKHGRKHSRSKVVRIKTKHGESIKLETAKPVNPADFSLSDVEKKIHDMEEEIGKLKGSSDPKRQENPYSNTQKNQDGDTFKGSSI
ncbi:MAG TPA: hypothetical protein VI815_04430 [Candidatus Nanoarchaeia archaeon]|nr:hypothetical protein [Candidatus Nanoarchaeia archaeon]